MHPKYIAAISFLYTIGSSCTLGYIIMPRVQEEPIVYKKLIAAINHHTYKEKRHSEFTPPCLTHLLEKLRLLKFDSKQSQLNFFLN